MHKGTERNKHTHSHTHTHTHTHIFNTKMRVRLRNSHIHRAYKQQDQIDNSRLLGNYRKKSTVSPKHTTAYREQEKD